jgi:hypothetical protein
MRRLILAATAFLSGVAGGCFLKPASAPGFRYTCESDADCLARDCKGGLIPMADAEGLIEGCDTPEVKADGTLGVGYRQTCIAGLCEFACDIYTFAEPTARPPSGYSFCFNGRCANICGTDDLTKYNFDSTDDFCTPPQRCIPFSEDRARPERPQSTSSASAPAVRAASASRASPTAPASAGPAATPRTPRPTVRPASTAPAPCASPAATTRTPPPARTARSASPTAACRRA